jgi:hypothetical protein
MVYQLMLELLKYLQATGAPANDKKIMGAPAF